MSVSAIHEFAKIASVDSVYEVYELADKLGGSPERAARRRRENESVIGKKIRENRLAKMEAARAAAEAGKPAVEAVPAPTHVEAPVHTHAPAPHPEPHTPAPHTPAPHTPAPHTTPTVPHHAPAAPHAPANPPPPGALRRAADMLMRNKGKAALGLTAAGAGTYALHRYNRSRNEGQ